MKKIITRVTPWQSAKTMALVYFAMGVLVGLPMALLSSFLPAQPGQARPGPLFFLALPFLYGIVALVFVPICCWIYNKAAAIVGGVELDVETRSDA